MPTGAVLIAEDDVLVTEILTRICQELFAEVVVRNNGNDALELLGARPFDLLVTDLRMPGASGLSLLAESRRRAPTCPMLLISGYADDDAMQKARLLGAEVLHKPFGAKSLRTVIRRLCPALRAP
jgi:DNA-binding NtrC family response regulator